MFCSRMLAALTLALVSGCAAVNDDAPGDDEGYTPDDAGFAPYDAGALDATTTAPVGYDAGTRLDAGNVLDAGVRVDASTRDSAVADARVGTSEEASTPVVPPSGPCDPLKCDIVVCAGLVGGIPCCTSAGACGCDISYVGLCL